MADANTTVSIEQARREIADFCSDGDFKSAHLLLIQNGVGPELAPGLWEYLARRSHVGGDKTIAHAARRALWKANIWTGDVALKEAGYYLDKGDYSSSAFLLEAVFGTDPEVHEARILLARCHLLAMQAKGRSERLLADRDAAHRLAKGMSMKDGNQAKTAIDLLRFSDQFEKALEFNDEARANFPDDIRFMTREARIREQLNDLDRAVTLWNEIADAAPRYRIEALFKIVALCRLLDRDRGVQEAAAALVLEKLSISERLRLAQEFDQQAVVHALIEFASTGGPAAKLIDGDEGAAIAEILLDYGEIGHLAWLRKLRIPIGQKAMSILDALGFHVNGDRPIPQTFKAAAKVRSPDFLLPLGNFLEQEKKPAGWPGTGTVPEKILLVNAALGMGGAERQFVTLVRSLIGAGIRPETLEIAIFSLSEDRGHRNFLPELEKLDVRIHDLRERQVHNKALPMKVKALVDALPTPLRQDTTALWHLANQIQPNVIHGWQDRSALAGGIVGQILSTERVILSARNMSPASRQDARLMALRELYREFSALENYRLTANSTASARDYEDWIGCPRGTVSLLSNAVDRERFSPAAVKPVKPRPADAPIRITGIFRLVVNKRPQLWLRTVAELRHVHNLAVAPRICGKGPLRDDIVRLATELGLGDLQLQTSTADPAVLYGEADMLLLMSSVEGMPNVILEAQACGIPVAACDVGGVREALHRDGTGGGLILEQDISPETAAAEIRNWLPQAASAPVDDRVAYVDKHYGMTRLASRVEAFYCGFPGVAP